MQALEHPSNGLLRHWQMRFHAQGTVIVESRGKHQVHYASSRMHSYMPEVSTAQHGPRCTASQPKPLQTAPSLFWQPCLWSLQ